MSESFGLGGAHTPYVHDFNEIPYETLGAGVENRLLAMTHEGLI